jgi:hypothetical protein
MVPMEEYNITIAVFKFAGILIFIAITNSI